MTQNLIFNKKGELVKRKTWKTLRGAFVIIKKLNEDSKRLGYKTQITIDLPLKN